MNERAVIMHSSSAYNTPLCFRFAPNDRTIRSHISYTVPCFETIWIFTKEGEMICTQSHFSFLRGVDQFSTHTYFNHLSITMAFGDDQTKTAQPAVATTTKPQEPIPAGDKKESAAATAKRTTEETVSNLGLKAGLAGGDAADQTKTWAQQAKAAIVPPGGEPGHRCEARDIPENETKMEAVKRTVADAADTFTTRAATIGEEAMDKVQDWSRQTKNAVAPAVGPQPDRHQGEQATEMARQQPPQMQNQAERPMQPELHRKRD